VTKPVSDKYVFDELLSRNSICEGWKATRTDTGEICLVKCLNSESTPGTSLAQTVLSNSYTNQRELRSTRVLRARSRSSENGRLCIEYPYLDPSRWQPITPDSFARDTISILTRLCVITDYLHAFGLVHCDLKLENFLLNRSTDKVELTLVDMDFVTRSDSHPGAIVMGTPDHIPPEITANDRVAVQSDNYSLGVSLGRYADEATSRAYFPSEVSKGLKSLVKDLTQKDYLARPRHLLPALEKSGLLNEEELATYQREVLSMIVLSRYRRTRRSDLSNLSGLRRFCRDRCRMLGLHDELLVLLSDKFASERLTACRLFKRLILESRITRLADFWLVQIDDDALYDIYGDLENAGSRLPGLTGRSQSVTSAALFRQINRARHLTEQGHLERAFYQLRRVLTQIAGGGTESSDSLEEWALAHLASLALTLHRAEQSKTYLVRLFELLESRECVPVQLFDLLCKVNIRLGLLDEADKFVKLGLAACAAGKGGAGELYIRRAEIWLHILRGEYDDALNSVQVAMHEASSRGLHDLLVELHYFRSITLWRKGDVARAIQELDLAIKLIDQENLWPAHAYVLGMMANLQIETATYESAISFGKRAVKQASEAHDYWVLPFGAISLSHSFVRLADFPKASYWLDQALNTLSQVHPKAHLYEYLHARALLLINQGAIDQTQEAASAAVEVMGVTGDIRVGGKTYHILAESAAYAAQFERFKEYIEPAREIFEKSHHTVSLLELDLLSHLRDISALKSVPASVLVKLAGDLIERKSIFCGVLSLFYALLRPDAVIDTTVTDLAASVRSTITPSRVPAFTAVSHLLDAGPPVFEASHASVGVWKDVFRVLLNSRQLYGAMLVAMRIGDFYVALSQYKHARKFLQQALKLAEDLTNQPIINWLEDKIHELSHAFQSEARLVDSFLQVSTLIRELPDYSESLRRLIQFAVDQTGAERGVLLLRRADSNELYVGAAVNCDDKSLEDIVDFSGQIARTTSEEQVPILIENALEDRRTNKYQSVLYHNILSVACVPLMDSERSIGVLYLDHHSIPALFEKDDYAYIEAISNFMSVTVTTSRDYKTLAVTNRELTQDLGRIGELDAFITRDQETRDLLAQLPRLAKTDTPVLIEGESGTGKEILCHRIHKLSTRADLPLVKLNCAAIQSTLIESELFGVSKNVATGVSAREGKFSAADNGTLFLDEIGDMPLEIQAKVLRVLETQQFEKVGSNRTIYTDIRFIYATNRPLEKMVKDGSFRSDLYYRIQRLQLRIAPLRNRPRDIPLLLEHFSKIFSTGQRPPVFTRDALDTLVAYRWPGNVRELKNFVERLCIICPGQRIAQPDLPEEMVQSASDNVDVESKQSVEEIESNRIKKALKRTSGNVSAAARLLQIAPTTLRRKIRRYGLRPAR
jgi:transcriptional regulator with GAF, ATPase, and Fis domain/serine/threonine protein kinase